MPDLTQEEFISRFVRYCVENCGFTHFTDGQPVEEYSGDIALTYWAEPWQREDGPEACAESEMSYWGEE